MRVKIYIPEIVLGALLAVAIFAMGFVFALSPQPQAPANQQRQEEGAKKQPKDQQQVGALNWAIPDAMSLYNLILVFFTGALAGVGWIQIRQTRILQRAYVSVNPGGIDTNTFYELLGHVIFENVGHLPARDFSWRVKIRSDTNRDWVPESMSTSDLVGDAVLSVGAKWKIGSPALGPKPVLDWEFVFVWGRVEYTDGFGKRRHTNFCHRYPWARVQTTVDGQSVDLRISTDYARATDKGNDGD